jgi:hypothetical protein
MYRRVFPLLAFLGLPIALGCQHDVTTSFPPGLQPLDVDGVPAPNGTSTDPFPESINVQTGNDDTSNYGHGTGYVHANINDVWAAMKDPEVIIDRHHIDAWTVDWNVEPDYDVSFRTNYTVNGIVTVKFSLTWREGVVAGPKDKPTQVSVVYEKTQGSSYINLMKGSIQLVAVSDTVTELQYAERLDAPQTDEGTISSWINSGFASVVARVHGQPLP